MRLRPVEALLEPPSVDDVADQIDGLAIDAVEEIDQHRRVAAARAQMDVGNPDGAIPATLPFPLGNMELVVSAFFHLPKEGQARDGVHDTIPRNTVLGSESLAPHCYNSAENMTEILRLPSLDLLISC